MQIGNSITLEDVFNAFLECRKKKKDTNDYLKFEFNREKNLIKLHDELFFESYNVGRSIHFIVEKPKIREVWAGNFRDRIVHHLLCQKIQDRFLKRFIDDSYSCIINKGTLYGAERVYSFARKATKNYQEEAYYLQCDLHNYFLSINRNILHNLLLKYVHEREYQWLIRKILFHDPRKNYYSKATNRLMGLLPKHKTLFSCDNIHGMPIGNLTSQFFSNVYLNELDQFVKRTLKIKYYGRYVDDFVLIHKDIEYLKYCHQQIQIFLREELDLKLNPSKTKHNHVKKGIDFVGYLILPGRKQLRRKTRKKLWQHLKTNDIISKQQNINSYLGMLKHTSSYQERKSISFNVNNRKSLLVMDYPYLKFKKVQKRI